MSSQRISIRFDLSYRTRAGCQGPLSIPQAAVGSAATGLCYRTRARCQCPLAWTISLGSAFLGARIAGTQRALPRASPPGGSSTCWSATQSPYADPAASLRRGHKAPRLWRQLSCVRFRQVITGEDPQVTAANLKIVLEGISIRLVKVRRSYEFVLRAEHGALHYHRCPLVKPELRAG